MAQTSPIWQRFNPRKNQSHCAWLLLGVVSFIASVIGITFAVLEHRHNEQSVQGTIVRVETSGGEGLKDDKQGSIRVVWGFDFHNNVLGSSSLDTIIDAWSSKEIQIQQNLNKTAPARYIDLIAGENEICISAIVTRFPNGEELPWYGDVGAACGQAWEYDSKLYLSPNGTQLHAKCVWMSAIAVQDIDGDGPKTIQLKQMKIDISAYGRDVGPAQIANNTDLYCGATIFSEEDENPISRVPGDEATTISSANSSSMADLPSPRSRRSAERLVISTSDQHAAAELCHSSTSRGSDFVSRAESLFCDMETKTLHPLCGRDVESDCFDVDSHELKSKRRDVRAKRRYTTVSMWS